MNEWKEVGRGWMKKKERIDGKNERNKWMKKRKKGINGQKEREK